MATLQLQSLYIQIVVEQSLLVVQLTARAQRCIILAHHKHQGDGEGSSDSKRSTGDTGASVLLCCQEGFGWLGVKKVPGLVGREDVQDRTDGQQTQE